MTHMGSSAKWINLVMTIYSEASAYVALNGIQGETFILERSVCQGCLLALYLYLLVANVLGRMLDNPTRISRPQTTGWDDPHQPNVRG